MPFIFSHGQTCCEGVVSPVCAMDFVKLWAHPLHVDSLTTTTTTKSIKMPKSVKESHFSRTCYSKHDEKIIMKENSADCTSWYFTGNFYLSDSLSIREKSMALLILSTVIILRYSASRYEKLWLYLINCNFPCYCFQSILWSCACVLSSCFLTENNWKAVKIRRKLFVPVLIEVHSGK